LEPLVCRLRETAAKAVGLTLDNIQIRNASGLETALPALSRARPDRVSVIANTVLLARRRRIVELMTAKPDNRCLSIPRIRGGVRPDLLLA
jgi:hypothetical protein